MTETTEGVKKSQKMTGRMEGSTSEAVPTSSSPRKDGQASQMLILVRAGCQGAMHSLSTRRTELSQALNPGRSQQKESLIPRPGFEKLNALLQNIENILRETMKSTWKVKAEEINDEQAKNSLGKLRDFCKHASEAKKKMSALLQKIKGMDPISADALIHDLMETNK